MGRHPAEDHRRRQRRPHHRRQRPRGPEWGGGWGIGEGGREPAAGSGEGGRSADGPDRGGGRRAAHGGEDGAGGRAAPRHFARVDAAAEEQEEMVGDLLAAAAPAGLGFYKKRGRNG